MKWRGSQASVADETVQFLTDHRFGKLGHDLPNHALDDLSRKLEHALDLVGREAERFESRNDRMRQGFARARSLKRRGRRGGRGG